MPCSTPMSDGNIIVHDICNKCAHIDTRFFFFFCIANLPLNVTQTREKQQQRMKYVKKEGEAHFEQVKPSCHLLPVKRLEEFLFSADDFTSIITNLQTIEMLKRHMTHPVSSSTSLPPSKSFITYLLYVSLSSSQTFLFHHYLGKRKKNLTRMTTVWFPFIFLHRYQPSWHHSEYTINNWPVPYANEFHLDPIKQSHDIQQLPA